MFENHDLKFKYVRTSSTRHFVRPDGPTYEVHVGGTLIGFVEKGGGGYEAYSPGGRYVTYRVGVRRYAAEELAREAGLLDPNYNDIDPNNWT